MYMYNMSVNLDYACSVVRVSYYCKNFLAQNMQLIVVISVSNSIDMLTENNNTTAQWKLHSEVQSPGWVWQLLCFVTHRKRFDNSVCI